MNNDPAPRELFDLDAEMAVLGSMMLASDVIAEVEGILSVEAFYRPHHGIVFRTIVELHAGGKPCDPVAVTATLADSGELPRIGGAPYLHDLVTRVPVAANGPHYARTVAEFAQLREVDKRSREIQRLIQAGGMSATEVLDRAQESLADVHPAGRGEDGLRVWGEIGPEVLEAIEQAAANGDETSGIPTGFLDLDRMLNGLRPGQLVVIAGRPGMGKSVALAGILQHASWRHKLPSAMFSLEMTRVELGTRMVSADSRVPLHAMQSGQLADSDWTRVARSIGESGNAPLWIDDTPDMTLADIRSRARRLHRRSGGLALVGIDYLQLIAAPRAESRQVAVSAISRGLKMLGKELGVPVVVAAQVNRGPEQRTDKRPQLADLRESGAIEADADIVILLHRDDYYDNESPRAGEADFIVAKHRGGPTDTVTVAAQLHLSRFVDMAMP